MTTPTSTASYLWQAFKVILAVSVIVGVVVAASREHDRVRAATATTPQNTMSDERSASAGQDVRPVAEPRAVPAFVRPHVADVKADDGVSPPPPPEPGEGKVYVTSDPPGAEIFVEKRNHELDSSGKVTPALVSVPRRCTLILRIAGFNDAKLQVNAKDDSIQKPAAVVLEKQLFDIDIVAERGDGFAVFIDKTPATDKSGQPAVIPCTVSLSVGEHEFGLAKEGFRDTTKTFNVDAKGELKFDDAPTVGVSKLLQIKAVDAPATVKNVAAKNGSKLPQSVAKDAVMFLSFSRDKVKIENGITLIKNLGSDGGVAVANGGTLVDGGWSLNGKSDSIVFTPPKLKQLKDKTFSAWVQVADVNQSGGGVVSVQAVAGEPFDSLVYNEQHQGWMFGSDGFNRTSNSDVHETKSEWVHVAATYKDQEFVLYRNGKLIATEKRFACQEFASPFLFLIGQRHTTGRGNAFLNGAVNNVAVISRALTEQEVQAIYRAGR